MGRPEGRVERRRSVALDPQRGRERRDMGSSYADSERRYRLGWLLTHPGRAGELSSSSKPTEWRGPAARRWTTGSESASECG